MPKRPVFDRCVHVVQSVGIWNFCVQVNATVSTCNIYQCFYWQIEYMLGTEASFAVGLTSLTLLRYLSHLTPSSSLYTLLPLPHPCAGEAKPFYLLPQSLAVGIPSQFLNLRFPFFPIPFLAHIPTFTVFHPLQLVQAEVWRLRKEEHSPQLFSDPITISLGNFQPISQR